MCHSRLLYVLVHLYTARIREREGYKNFYTLPINTAIFRALVNLFHVTVAVDPFVRPLLVLHTCECVLITWVKMAGRAGQ